MELPKRYDPKEAEPRLQDWWHEQKIFKFDPDSKKEIFSIDTPPPTVSGKMHLGHAFSYSQEDFVARYKRMAGFNVFYPFGTDDNGLATEKLIEKEKKVNLRKMGREEFVKLCLDTLETEIRPQFIKDWKNIGMSCDFDIFYTTINEHCQRISQRMFLDLVKKNRVTRKEAPVLWCPHCATALSQVEIEDIELASHFNDIIFKIDGKEVIIATTRPELLAACVAVLYHPNDDRFKKYEGKKATVPIFNHEVPIYADKRVDPEKGSGIVMCCTFGDQTDIEWQKAFNLPIKKALTNDGRMTKLAANYEGLKIKEARKQILEDMKEQGLLVQQKEIKHAVNVHERCSTEIEFHHSPQWFIKYLDLKETFLERGLELKWHPDHMRNRYENWIKGLQWDWCISRQRYSGIPFPVWYDKKTNQPIYANEADLPVDPLKDVPQGYTKDQVRPEQDIMDTWATSSLTPQLATELFKDHPVYKKLLPMNLRPQAHDIITFWLFNTVVRSHIHDNQLPWKECMISGWALDPKGKKMSKSKGNVIAPQDMIEKYSADALRFWAAGSRLGDDLPFQEKDLVTGQKFITKIWNASKFAMMHLENYHLKEPKNLEVIDRWLLSKISRIVQKSTEHFDKYEYSHVKLATDSFFWQSFCNDYLEIAKDRLYNPDARGEDPRVSAQYTLYNTLLTIIKLMAPITPYITEELYQLFFKQHEKTVSIHNTAWPTINKVDEQAESAGDFFVSILAEVRKAKSEQNISLKTPIKRILAKGDITKELFESMKLDLVAATKAQKIEFEQLAKDSKKEFEIVVDL